MLKAASQAGFNIDRVYFCPHGRADDCDCRKPKAGMIKRAVRELNLDLKNSFMIGDMTSDIKAGIEAGCKTILVKTGQGGKDALFEVTPQYVADDLRDAARWIVSTFPLTAKS